MAEDTNDSIDWCSLNEQSAEILIMSPCLLIKCLICIFKIPTQLQQRLFDQQRPTYRQRRPIYQVCFTCRMSELSVRTFESFPWMWNEKVSKKRFFWIPCGAFVFLERLWWTAKRSLTWIDLEPSVYGELVKISRTRIDLNQSNRHLNSRNRGLSNKMLNFYAVQKLNSHSTFSALW